MTVPTTPPASRRCWPLTLAFILFSACFVAPLCLFVVLQLNAGYWYLLRSTASLDARPALAEGQRGPGPGSFTDDASGAQIFSTSGCSGCHALEPGVTRVGPSLAGIGQRAGATVPDLSAEDYLRQSITDPDAHVVSGFSAGMMPAAYGQKLSSEDLDSLVAYLLGR